MNKKNIFSINKKNILITGGSRGNGLEISKGLLKENARVLILDKVKFPSHILKKYPKSLFIKCDLSKQEDLDYAVAKGIKLFKKIDVLINNAGISLNTNHTNALDVWNKTMEVNLKAPYILTQKISNYMKPGSSIINITSMGAHLGFSNNPSYISSKGGLSSLTKSFAFDYAEKEIRVNNIVPGYFKTQMTEKSRSNKKMSNERESRMLVKRWGNSKDLLGPVIFLASDASSYITGTDIFVDGGWVSKGV